MKLFLIVARRKDSDNDFSTFLFPAADEDAAAAYVREELTEMDPDDEVETDVSIMVGEYMSETTLRVPEGTDWALDTDAQVSHD
jgi:hypothetical protein